MDIKEQLQQIYDDLYEVSTDVDNNQNWQAISRLANIQNRLESIVDKL
ncbi:MAG: hypothetical protein K0S18_132 [Anaerocolumna sp.]|jgi:hypothetical protein|nr:hypothetical protein [Anaerocolumna sp.]